MVLRVIILAAGQGTRMRSALPKVLHPVGGVPMLHRVVNTVQQLHPEKIYIIYGHGGDQVRESFADKNFLKNNIIWVEQHEQKGTGHAVQQVLPELQDFSGQILILYADAPLISIETLNLFTQQIALNTLGVITAVLNNPNGLGRILRDHQNQKIIRIVEEKDASDVERQIKEINTGIYLVSSANLQNWLPKLTPHNAQRELYITDIIALAVASQTEIKNITVQAPEEILGVNDREQLVFLERYYQQKLAAKYLREGVMIMDPARIDIRGNAVIKPDVIIDINNVFEGEIYIDSGSVIEPNCVLRNVRIGKNTRIKANSVIEDSVIGDHCQIGPFARIRPGTALSEAVSVGNFVEIKNSKIQSRSKIPHLSYVGDADIGEQVNIGAGVITCNYDGVKKSRTLIHDKAFIGSDSQLIAPVEIGEGAYIAAGSTISKNAPPEKLTIARAKQQTVSHWKPPQKPETNSEGK